MKAKGLEVILSGRRSNGGGYVYFDTRKVGGTIIELMKVVEKLTRVFVLGFTKGSFVKSHATKECEPASL